MTVGRMLITNLVLQKKTIISLINHQSHPHINLTPFDGTGEPFNYAGEK